MLTLDSLHLLLTFQCTFECDHCFLWGSPNQCGTMRIRDIERILDQAGQCGIASIYFEGGEPFLYYGTLLAGVRRAAERGMRVGIVSNAYWANDLADARECLAPFAGLLRDLSLSSDGFHAGDHDPDPNPRHALQAAEELGIDASLIRIAAPGAESSPAVVGQLPAGESPVHFRGRAAERLAPDAPKQPWTQFDACPYEALSDPGRLHVDPLGNLHGCQGIVVGNIFGQPLSEILGAFDARSHPVTGPLLEGGPAELIRRYHLPHEAGYADACHACYHARCALRERLPDALGPDQVYGV